MENKVVDCSPTTHKNQRRSQQQVILIAPCQHKVQRKCDRQNREKLEGNKSHLNSPKIIFYSTKHASQSIEIESKHKSTIEIAQVIMYRSFQAFRAVHPRTVIEQSIRFVDTCFGMTYIPFSKITIQRFDLWLTQKVLEHIE